ncbi:Uncharacterised protein [Mycobacteroides abscessus subsp. massiliense]|nr:Uncharacterised protein [Mycobacteroides abscessus subsp. massiliense]
MLDEDRRRVIALTQHRGLQPAAHHLGRFLCGAHRGEQSQGAASCRPHEGFDLVECCRADTVASGGRKVACQVENGGFLVLEGGPDIDAVPSGLDLGGGVRGGLPGGQPPRGGHRIEPSAEGERCGGENHGALSEEPGAQQPGDRERGNPQHGAYGAPVVLMIQPHHIGPCGDVRFGPTGQCQGSRVDDIVESGNRFRACGGRCRVGGLAGGDLGTRRGGSIA